MEDKQRWFCWRDRWFDLKIIEENA